MEDPTARIAALLHEAGEIHHVADRTVDGDDHDGVSWDADWLSNRSELLAVTPVRSEPVWLLAALDTAYADSAPATPRSQWYAERIVEHLGAKENAQ